MSKTTEDESDVWYNIWCCVLLVRTDNQIMHKDAGQLWRTSHILALL
jgi:hypothetical protein